MDINIINLKFNVSNIVLKDIEEILSIENDIQKFPWSNKNFVDSILSGYYSILIKDTGNILGFLIAMFAPDMTNILNIGVSNKVKRTGIGSCLLIECVKKSLSLGQQGLLIEVASSNLEAIKFYEKHNFNYIGIRKNYYISKVNGIKDDALVMKKNLFY